MTLSFSRKTAGIHTAKVSTSLEFALINAGGGCGWSVVLRDAKTRKVQARVGSGITTLGACKATAQKLTESPKFGAVLLRLA